MAKARTVLHLIDPQNASLMDLKKSLSSCAANQCHSKNVMYDQLEMQRQVRRRRRRRGTSLTAQKRALLRSSARTAAVLLCCRQLQPLSGPSSRLAVDFFRGRPYYPHHQRCCLGKGYVKACLTFDLPTECHAIGFEEVTIELQCLSMSRVTVM